MLSCFTDVRCAKRGTCAQVFEWCQNKIHENLYFLLRTRGQEPQHNSSPRSDASLSTSARPSPPLHLAVQESVNEHQHKDLIALAYLIEVLEQLIIIIIIKESKITLMKYSHS